jgi:putative hemolysin
MTYARHALTDAGRLGVIFPSGRLAKRVGLRLHERPWMSSAAALARKFDLPVIPVHIRARNSALYYLFDAIHPTLRDITLFHETLNKASQPYLVTIGAPIAAADLPRDPVGGHGPPARRDTRPRRDPGRPRVNRSLHSSARVRALFRTPRQT